MDPNVRSVHSKQALAVYAESLVDESRVAVFGNAAHGLGSRFVELGAKTVEVWDPDAIRARAEAQQATSGVTVHVYSSAEATPRRAIDLAIVADLGLFDDADALIARIRDMVGDAGVVLISAVNRDAAPHPDARAFDYYELFDLVAAQFAEVRMVAQVSFHGVALVRLGDEDEAQAVSVDTQLADTDRAADAFVVIASQRPASFDPYTIIELPTVSDGAALREVEAARTALADALGQAQAEHSEDHRRVEALHAELRARIASVERASERNAELEGLLLDQSTRASELEAALVERALHLSELSTEIEEIRATAEVVRVATAEIEQMARRADRAELRGGELERELAGVADVHAGELVRFEEGLRERGQAIQALEAELQRREKMVRELVSAVEEASSVSAHASIDAPLSNAVERVRSADDFDKESFEENARLREQLNALALDLARREGEVQAAAWTVAELERKLAQTAMASEAPAPPPPQEADVRSALDEADALRRALAQEHADRKKAESGEALARAEVEKQAQLLEQMARQLDSQRREGADGGERPTEAEAR